MALILAAGSAAASAQAASLYVSPDGSDANSGAATAPLRSFGKALDIAKGGETVYVAPGSYPKPATLSVASYTHDRVLPAMVTVKATGPGVVAQGFRVDRGTNVRFEGIEWVDTLQISTGARNIEVVGNEFRGGENGIYLRNSARDVLIAGNHFHDIGTAVKGAPEMLSRVLWRITIRDNVMEDLRVDGIQFGFWNDVAITDNVIRRLDHPLDTLHNDGIQVYGEVVNALIARNRVYDSRGQGIMVSSERGQLQNVTIADNVVYMTDGVPLYTVLRQTDKGTRVTGNTVWRNPAHSSYAGIVVKAYDNLANEVVVANNIASQIAYGMPVGYRGHNISATKSTWWTRYQLPGPGEVTNIDPRFVDRSNADFRLQPTSPARSAGTASYTSLTDVAGLPRLVPPSIGAYEYR